jgi:hypothetical protein
MLPYFVILCHFVSFSVETSFCVFFGMCFHIVILSFNHLFILSVCQFAVETSFCVCVRSICHVCHVCHFFVIVSHSVICVIIVMLSSCR